MLLAVCVALPADEAAFAQEQPTSEPDAREVDKSRFTLFNPAPKEALREFNSDRPDVTESPYTLDAGHFQYEAGLFSFTRAGARGERTDTSQVLPSNLKLGLLNNVDLQLVAEPYDNALTKTRHKATRGQGCGPTELRLKANLFGNDGGNVAVGLLPFIRFPTGGGRFSSGHIEGGFIVPVAFKLPAGFDLGTEVAFDFVRNQANDGYGVEFTHTLTLEHDIVGKLAGYVEYVGVSPYRTGQTYAPSIGTGLLYALTENVQLDGGVNVGLSDDADDVTVFLGLSFRL